MIQRSKKGFSLIEVLILFTVLAVVLAASIPVISRKSSPVPNKINHGVYRCIHDNNGLREEIYTGTRRVKPEEGHSAYVNACTFRVPAAALYRIDLYSAGAGGTQAASINTYDDDVRNIDYQITAPHYNNYTYTNSTGAPVGDIPKNESALLRRLTSAELQEHLNHDNIVRNVYTLDAGEGGTAKFASYNAPTISECLGHVGATTVAEIHALNKKGEFTRDSKNYNQALKDLDDFIKEHEDEEHNQQQIKQTAAENDSTYKLYTNRKTKLETLINAIDNFSGGGANPDNYKTIRTGCYSDFQQGLGIQPTMGNTFSNMEAAITSTLATRQKNAAISSATNALNKAYQDYEDSGYAKDLQDAVDAAVASARTKYVDDARTKAKEDFEKTEHEGTDEEIAAMLTQAQADAETKAKEDFEKNEREKVETNTTNNFYKKVKGKDYPFTMRDQISFYYGSTGQAHATAYVNGDLYTYIYDNDINDDHRAAELGSTTAYNSYLSSIKTEALGILSKVQSKINSMDRLQTEHTFEEQKKIAAGLEESNRKDKEQGQADYLVKVQPFIDDYNELLGIYHDLLAGNLSGVVQARGYTNDDIYDPAGNTKNQLENYCAEAYGKREGGSSDLIVRDLPKDNPGAERGVGQYMTVSFPLEFKVPDGASAENYNYETFLESIEGSGSFSLKPVFCTGKNGEGDCTTSLPNYDLHGKNVGVEEEVKYERNKSNSEMFELKGTDRVFKTTDGEDLKLSEKVTHPYAAWRVPLYTNGNQSSRKYMSNVADEPTGGEKSNMWVEEIDKPTHTYKSFEIGATTPEIANGVIDNVLAYRIKTSPSKPGDPATFGGPVSQPVYNDRQGNATILTLPASESNTSTPLFKDPRIRIHSELWSKEYFAGGRGGQGNSKTFVAASIGSNCTFDVPAPGRVYVPGSDDPISLEEALQVRMTCFNREGVTVFDRALNGGKYNTRDLIPAGSFNWVSGREQYEVAPETGHQPDWKPTSIWARVVREWMMSGGNNYDLASRYGVGRGGDGTTIIDRCVVPKGFFTTQTIHFFQTGAALTESQVPVGSATLRDQDMYTGKIGDQDCYGYPAEGSHFVENYDLSARDIYYDVYAGQGGGGAVVITW